MPETWAIKRSDRIIYIAKEQFGPPRSLTVSTESGSPYYHPKQFESEAEAKTYLDTVVRKTAMGQRWPWKIVKYT
jgi:hypothetical protein